jgi:hypothetical protein
MFIITNSVIAQEQKPDTNYNPVTQEAVISAGTALDTLLVEEINADKAYPGDTIKFKLLTNLVSGNKVILPQNSTFEGIITEFSRASLLGNTYSISATIDRVTTPFGREYKISAHPEFELKEHKKKKGHLVTFQLINRNNKGILPDDNKYSGSKKTGESFVIPEGEPVKVILDKDFSLSF